MRIALVLAVLSCFVLGCGPAEPPPASPHAGHEGPAAEPGAVPLYDNLGTHTRPVTTTVPEAQKYFDQGLRLVYGFNHDEAQHAFEEAARLDPQCAMAWWGVAYTLGPNINLPTDPDREKAAVAAVLKARAATGASEAERAYVEALATRYSTDPASDRTAKDRAYADAMRELSKKYPDDLDAATLFAESMMDLRPWHLWTKDGKPEEGTEEIVATLESVLRRDPNHPGANHYYIHATEASPHPERALPSAKRFAAGLVPGAGHLVHMPAHVFQRMGSYADAAEANRKAAAVDREYLAKSKAQGIYPMMYYSHNLQFLSASEAMLGRAEESIQAARDLEENITPEMVKAMPMAEFVAPNLLWALARFERWDEILAQPAPPEFMKYTTGMGHYVRGLAQSAKGNAKEAASELRQLDEIRAEIPADLMMNLNYARPLLEIASHVLSGEIAARAGKTDEAVRHLREGIRLEDDLSYDEPPAWFTPVRQTLAAVLVAAGRRADAAQAYREDLERHPNNVGSTRGLAALK